MIDDINGVKVWRVPEDGPVLGSGDSASELIGESYRQGADLLALPVKRFDPAFFRLGSGLAGEFIQKLQMYGYRIAVVGDLETQLAKSAPLRDFVRETNRRGEHLFVADDTYLRAKLSPR